MRNLEEIYESLDADIKSFAIDVATKLDMRKMKEKSKYGDSEAIRQIIIHKMKKEGWSKS